MDNVKLVLQDENQNVKIEYTSACNDYEESLNKIGELKIIEKKSEDIESLLEIFPEYQEAFLQQCLEYFNFNKDQLINAILENNLPECLQNLLKPKSNENIRSVFDGDEFDLKNKNKIDYSKIHIGKRYFVG
jgi:hypothetical protein